MNDKLKHFYEVVKASRAHKIFDFTTINSTDGNHKLSTCGTAGCLMGELPHVFPDVWMWNKITGISLIETDLSCTDHTIMEFFDLTCGELYHLFYPNCQHSLLYGGKLLDESATIEDVLENLRVFIEKNS